MFMFSTILLFPAQLFEQPFEASVSSDFYIKKVEAERLGSRLVYSWPTKDMAVYVTFRRQKLRGQFLKNVKLIKTCIFLKFLMTMM